MIGSSQVATTLVGMIRNKLLAVILGPRGVGLFAQLQTVQTFTASVVPMGMQIGFLTYVAKYRARDAKLLPQYVSTASKVFLSLSVLTVVLCLIFARPVASLTLDDQRLFLYLIPPILGVPFLIQSQLWQTFLRANLEIRSYSLVAVYTALAGVAIAVPIVVVWRQWGATFHLLIVAVVGYMIARLLSNRSMDSDTKSQVRAAKFSLRVLWDLVRFGSANLPVFILFLGVPFLIRTQIINDLGLAANGIYQAVFAISSQYSNVPLNAVGAYILPKICQLADPKEINGEMNGAVRIVLLLNTFGILIILLFNDLAIRALFSSKFLPALMLFQWQMVGDLFKSVAMTIQVPLLPQERFRARNIQYILQYAVFLGVFYAAAPSDRLMGAVRAHAASWGFGMVITYGYVNWLNGFRFDSRNWILLATCIIAVVSVAFIPLPEPQRRFARGAIVAAWIATAMTKQDWRRLLEAIKNRIAQDAQAE